MTSDEAAAILGPELTAQITAQAAADGPLRPEQIALLVRLLGPSPAPYIPVHRDVA